MSSQWNDQQPYNFENADNTAASMAPGMNAVRDKMSVPSIIMMILAALGILSGVWTLANSLMVGALVPQINQTMQAEIQRAQNEMQRKTQQAIPGSPDIPGEMPQFDNAPGPDNVMPPNPMLPPTPNGPDLQGIFQIQNSIVQALGPMMAVFGFLSLALNGLAFWGALSMLNVKRHGLAITASIITMLPISSPCCLIGLPIGIWALVALTRPGVAAAFHRT
jgi:hypothetical protein